MHSLRVGFMWPISSGILRHKMLYERRSEHIDILKKLARDLCNSSQLLSNPGRSHGPHSLNFYIIPSVNDFRPLRLRRVFLLAGVYLSVLLESLVTSCNKIWEINMLTYWKHRVWPRIEPGTTASIVVNYINGLRRPMSTVYIKLTTTNQLSSVIFL